MTQIFGELPVSILRASSIEEIESFRFSWRCYCFRPLTSWIWKQQFLPKCRYIFTSLHGVISQTSWILNWISGIITYRRVY